MDNQKVLEKVKKLMALANHNSSEKEAESAMLAAQKLLAEHGLAMSDVDKVDEERQPVVTIDSRQLSRMPWWHKSLATIISRNFKCEVLVGISRINGLHTGTCIRFYGHPEDVEVCKTVYSFAVEQTNALTREFVKDYRWTHRDLSRTTGIRNDFIAGFLKGIKDKFQEQVECNGWGLVVVSDKEVQEAKNKVAGGKCCASSIRVAGSSEARTAGYTQGKKFEPVFGAIR